MSLNVAKGNMYDFVTHTWNTIKGECPHGCSYCYMHRWGKQLPVRFDEKELKTDLGEDNFIFVGLSCDMFALDIPEAWMLKTISHCARHYKNKYIFQSKNPGGFLSLLKVAYWQPTICTTIETNRWYPDVMQNSPGPYDRAMAMEYLDQFPHYVTIEPIMDFDMDPMVELIKRCNPVQVNIGADSGRNGLPEPSYDKVLELIERLGRFTTVARKRNLDRLGKP